ncbi:MAG: RNA polymerase sigma-70 factor [Mangrovibacterium sp.]|nr:RNA polymerase sigma-70 factor [Mangrovibacterium sp.]
MPGNKSFNALVPFEELFDKYYAMLCLIACDLVKNKQLAEEIVDEVFVHLWLKRESIDIQKSIRAYLIKSVQNRCMDWFQQTKAERLIIDNKFDISDHDMIRWSDDYPLGNLLVRELEDIVSQSIAALPERCREIFLLSRNEELTYEEIASKLSITINTVKTQMKIALSKLREALSDYLPIISSLVIQQITRILMPTEFF